MQQTSFKDKLKCSGAEEYKTFKDLKKEHGQENAEKLRQSKKEAQSKHGDAYPEVPHWMLHPDFPDQEVPWQYMLPFYSTKGYI